MDDNQRATTIGVYQGEHAVAQQNQKLGEYNLTGLTPLPAGKETIDVRFSYDINGILEVEMTVGSTGRTETMVIEQIPGRLTRDQIEQARAALAKLKTPPEEQLVNKALLTRADALYVELIGADRKRLGDCIAEFRVMLTGQDPAQIEAYREHLTGVVAALSSDRVWN